METVSLTLTLSLSLTLTLALAPNPHPSTCAMKASIIDCEKSQKKPYAYRPCRS